MKFTSALRIAFSIDLVQPDVNTVKDGVTSDEKDKEQ